MGVDRTDNPTRKGSEWVLIVPKTQLGSQELNGVRMGVDVTSVRPETLRTREVAAS
jgi:hypothetical protein